MASFMNSPAVTLCPPRAVSCPVPSSNSVCCSLNTRSPFSTTSGSLRSPNFHVVAAAEAEPLKILISGAPAAEDVLVQRVIGRRLDPVTGKIYHLKYSPPETEEIAARLTQRFDDTEEKVKLRLNTHNQHARDLLSMYQDITVKINGNCSKEEVFGKIDNALTKLAQQKDINISSFAR